MTSHFIITYQDLRRLLDITQGDDYVAFSIDDKNEIVLVKDSYIYPITLCEVNTKSAIFPRSFLKEVVKYALPNEFVVIKFTKELILVRLTHETLGTPTTREQR